MFYEKSYNFKLIPLAFQKLWHFLYEGEMIQIPGSDRVKESDRIRQG